MGEQNPSTYQTYQTQIPIMTNRIFSPLVSLCFFLLFFSGLCAQTPAEIRAAAEAAMEAYDVPGFAVGVIKDGKVVLAEGFGTRTAGKTETIDEHTLFAIASNTKAFVSTSIVKLHLEGKLDLDAPVRDYLPYFKVYDDYVSNHMLVRDLLCHRAGLGTFSGDAIWYKSALSAEQVIRQVRYLPQAYEWRAGYGYSNLMFITAGEVIRAVTGQSWAEYARENFLVPIGMERTQTSVIPLAKMSNVATPHLSRNDNQPIPYVNWDNMGAAGGIVSSAHDMLQWMNVQMNDGQMNGKEIFPAKLTGTTWMPHNALAGGTSFTSAGLGWFLRMREGHRLVNHGGGYDGMYSQVMMAPDDKLGVVVLTNSMTGLSSALANYIVNSYLGISTEDWLKKSIERQENGDAAWDKRHQDRLDARVMNTKASLPLDAYTDTYNDPMYGEIEVKLENGKLQLNFLNAPQLNAILSHWHYDTWLIEWKETHAWFDFGTVQFMLDNNRKVTGLRFDVPNDDIFFHEIEAEKE
jgi:CubicO group peptidase (beta-lactamase class C family)